jgi:hypothetical protein
MPHVRNLSVGTSWPTLPPTFPPFSSFLSSLPPILSLSPALALSLSPAPVILPCSSGQPAAPATPPPLSRRRPPFICFFSPQGTSLPLSLSLSLSLNTSYNIQNLKLLTCKQLNKLYCNIQSIDSRLELTVDLITLKFFCLVVNGERIMICRTLVLVSFFFFFNTPACQILFIKLFLLTVFVLKILSIHLVYVSLRSLVVIFLRFFF